MGIHRGPNIVKDNLVFGYDTGYGVADNNTATRFYPGRNTVNYLSDGISSYNIVQGTNWNGATPSYTLGTSEFGTPIGTYNTSGTSYMYSHDYVLDDDLSTLSAQTVTFSVYLKRQGASATVGIRIYDNISGYTTVYAAATNTFQRFTMSKTLGTNPTRIFVMIDNTNGGIIDFHSPQLEIGAASPFVDGTRSSTQSLIDLKRTTDIDVSNVSFDSIGQPDFDGTDDRIVASPSNISLGASLTMEVWIYPTGYNHSRMYLMDPRGDGNTNGTSAYFLFDYHASPDTVHVVTGNNNIEVQSSNFSMPLNNWHNIVATRNGNSWVIYHNGVSVGTGTTNTTSLTLNNDFRIGTYASGTSGQYFFEGLMAVAKIYDTGLSAEEVKQNYNAYKNRFNI